MENDLSHSREEKTCPFKSINNKLTLLARKLKLDLSGSTSKHSEYVSIIKDSFNQNRDYYINIHENMNLEDIKNIPNIDDVHKFSQFINEKMKQYFWEGIIFNENIGDQRKDTFTNIGNLGIDDVTMILEKILENNKGISIKELISKIDDEMFIRLKNNVLVDSIIHLDSFENPLIFENKTNIAKQIEKTLEESFIPEQSRFSKNMAPISFQKPMTDDGIIKNNLIIPQVTFGCPVGNVKKGEVFRHFVCNLIKHFFDRSGLV